MLPNHFARATSIGVQLSSLDPPPLTPIPCPLLNCCGLLLPGEVLSKSWRQIWRVGYPELLGSPRTSPEVFGRLPRKFLGDFPGSSLAVELYSNPAVPRKFPRLPRKFPGLPRRSALSLGSLAPSPDSQKLSLKIKRLFLADHEGQVVGNRKVSRWKHNKDNQYAERPSRAGLRDGKPESHLPKRRALQAGCLKIKAASRTNHKHRRQEETTKTRQRVLQCTNNTDIEREREMIPNKHLLTISSYKNISLRLVFCNLERDFAIPASSGKNDFFQRTMPEAPNFQKRLP